MRLLARRESGGIVVKLLWDETSTSDVVVEYEDRDQEISYTLHPPSERALDAFYHPNAYLGGRSLDAYSVKVY